MNGMIDDILQLKTPDFKSLVETRILLELKSVRLASLRRTDEELKMIKKALKAYEKKVLKGEDAVQEDLLFHLAIANASGNSTLNTFMLKITPEIITNFAKYHVCEDDRFPKRIEEHQAIYRAIESGDPKEAKQRMKDHFEELYKYCYHTD
jgi:GntR family transcriptional repressor for pyruvate dehydrogenase complex